MSRTVAYNLYSTATATGVNQSTVSVTRAGTIRGLVIQEMGTGGAGIGNIFAHVMLNAGSDNPGQNSSVSRETNLGGCVASCPNAGGYAVNSTFIAAKVPVQIGDVLSFALTVTGTAPATAFHKAQIIVEEN